MRSVLRWLSLLSALLVMVGPARAQLDNRAFTSAAPGASWLPHVSAPSDSLAGPFRLSVHAFTFFKDNEYFNKIADGYTLFGTQLNPQ